MYRFKHVALNNRPCSCKAPIALTCIDTDDSVKIILYTVDDDLNTSIIYHEESEDSDDLTLRCTKCGVDWSGYNPLFE